MFRRRLATTAILLAAGTPLWAQTVPPTADAGSQASDVEQAAVIAKQEAAHLRAYRLIGSTALGPDGRAVGKVQDFLIDRDRKIVAVVVGVGGFMGLGEKAVALPASRVDITVAFGEERIVAVNATKDELIAAPAFKSKETLRAEAVAAKAHAQPPAPPPAGSPPTQ